MSFLMNYGYKFEIGGATSTPATALPIGEGITSVDVDNNEETEETYYYNKGGAAETDVTGFRMAYSFTGHRYYGDPAQDYVFGLATKVGPDRKTLLTVTEPDGSKFTGPATISELQLPGGDANAKGDIEFTISFDGAPTYTPAPDAP